MRTLYAIALKKTLAMCMGLFIFSTDRFLSKNSCKNFHISIDFCDHWSYNIIVARDAGKELKMENKGMTDFQFKAFLETLLRFLENEEKEKAIELIKSLLNKK